MATRGKELDVFKAYADEPLTPLPGYQEERQRRQAAADLLTRPHLGRRDIPQIVALAKGPNTLVARVMTGLLGDVIKRMADS